MKTQCERGIQTIGVVAPFDYLCIYGGSIQRVKADLAEDFDLALRYVFKIVNNCLLHGMERTH